MSFEVTLLIVGTDAADGEVEISERGLCAHEQNQPINHMFLIN